MSQSEWNIINKKAYEDVGKKYDSVRPISLYTYLAKYFQKPLAKYLKGKKNILDVGCGTGNSTTFLDVMVKNSKILGIDQAKKMMSTAKKKKFQNKVHFKNVSVENFISNEKYDIIQYFQVIHHFKDLKVSMQQNTKYLKKGGYVFFMDFFSTNIIVKFLNYIYCKFLGQGNYKKRDYSSMKKTLRKTGFKVILQSEHPFLKNYGLLIAQKK